MSKLANQWIELFRAGDYPQGSFTERDLDEAVANYQPANPDFEEAPSTIGHPAGDAPAWAWWEAIKREGSTLLGKMKDVQPEFEDMVERRLFPKRSVGLVKRGTGWNLHHVAFLGAQAPAVKGLADCKFEHDGSAKVIEVAFEEDSMAGEDATLMTRLNAWFDEKFPKSATTGATFTEIDMKRFAEEAAAAAVAPVQAALTAQQATFAARDQHLATVETAARGQAAITKLKGAGKWVPAFEKAGLPQVFAELAKTTATVEFGEGATKAQATPLDLLTTFMESLKSIVPAGETYTGQTASGLPARKERQGADPNSVRFNEAIDAYMVEHGVSREKAWPVVAKAHPELTLPGGSADGTV